jgi:hypothetical protein
MFCPLPALNPPRELDYVNDPSRRRRHSRTLSIWNYLAYPFHLESLSTSTQSAVYGESANARSKRAPVAREKNVKVTMDIYLGFLLDSLPTYRNISKNKPNIKLRLIPFMIRVNHRDVFTFDPKVKQALKITVSTLISILRVSC